MGTLLNKSNKILNEKTTKIIPENIKEGIQIFDIVGTYSGSTIGGDVKRFNTMEEMYQDPNPQKGDLAVVYSDENINYTEELNNTIGMRGFVVRDNITLTEPIYNTDLYQGILYDGKTKYNAYDLDYNNRAIKWNYYYQEDQNKYYFNITHSLDEYEENFLIYMRYSSSDGLNWTLDTVFGDWYNSDTKVINFDKNYYLCIYQNNYEEEGKVVIEKKFSNGLGEFFEIPNVNFNGLFKYSNGYSLAPTQITVSNLAVLDGIFYGINGVEKGILSNTNIVNKAMLDTVDDLYNSYYNNITVAENAYELFNNKRNFPNKVTVTNLTTNMCKMFYNCKFNTNTLNNWDISNWDTSNVTDMGAIFEYAYLSNMNELNLTAWNTNNLKNINYIFYGIRGLSKINISGWNCPNLTTISSIGYFEDNSNNDFVLDISNCNFSNVTSLDSIIRFSPLSNSNCILNFENTVFGNISKIDSIAEELPENTYLNLGNLTFANKVQMYTAFSRCYNTATVQDFLNYHINVSNIARCFESTLLTEINLCNWNLSNTGIDYMEGLYGTFNGCRNLMEFRIDTNNLPKGAWGSLTLAGAFAYCNNLSEASIQNIIDLCLNINILNDERSLDIENQYSPFRYTNISNTRYQNRWAELDAAGWTY